MNTKCTSRFTVDMLLQLDDMRRDIMQIYRLSQQFQYSLTQQCYISSLGSYTVKKKKKKVNSYYYVVFA